MTLACINRHTVAIIKEINVHLSSTAQMAKKLVILSLKKEGELIVLFKHLKRCHVEAALKFNIQWVKYMRR